MTSRTGQPAIKGSTETSRMMLLTCASVGIAFTWGVEMTYCTPYLLSLGLTKGQASFVWLAGPISGLIVQPVIGVVSDQSTGQWGRRRPFMVFGTFLVVIALLALGFTREIVTGILGGSGAGLASLKVDADQMPVAPPHQRLIIVVAVLALYVVDFAINAVMSCARSLLVDTLPLEKQQDGAAWASRMASLGHLIGYAAGSLDLVSILGTTFGDTQFKILVVVAAAFMIFTIGVTCWAVTERPLAPPADLALNAPDSGITQLAKVFRQIWSTLLTLPPRMQGICWAVFWGWIGWFPFMFYSSTWVGETYFRYDVSPDVKDSNDALGDMGRIGSYALTAYSTATVLSSIVLPIFVRSPYDGSFTRRPPQALVGFAQTIEKNRPDLLTVWISGQVMFACAMLMAPFATSFRLATALVTICGIPWTVVTWAPTAFLGVEVNKLTGGKPGGGRRLSDVPLSASSNKSFNADGLLLERGPVEDVPAASSSGELSGIYFGILNMYTTVPQFLGNLLSMLVFTVLEPGKSPELAKDAHPSEHHNTDGPNAIAVTLFIGALFALISARMTLKLKHL